MNSNFETTLLDRTGKEWELFADVSGRAWEEQEGDTMGLHVEDLTMENIFIQKGEEILGLTDMGSLLVMFPESEIKDVVLKAEMEVLQIWMTRQIDEHDLYANGTEAI